MSIFRNFTLALFLLTGCAFAQDVVPLRHKATTSNPLLNQIAAAWSFDDDVRSGNRVATFGGFTLTDVNSKVGSMRANMGGSATFTNGGGYTLNLAAHDATFSMGPGKSFTAAFWLIGQNGNNSFIEVGDTTTPGNFDWRLDGGAFQVTDSGGTPHQLSWGAIDVTTFNLYVVGFNSATKQMFFSYAGAPKSFLSTGGLDGRDTGTYKLQLAYINGACDEFYWWNRVLTDAEILALNGTNSLGDKYPFDANGNNAALNQTLSYLWAVTNESGYVTTTSSNGVYQFVDRCFKTAIWTKFNMIVGFCPDTLAAGMIPIKTTWFQAPGNDIHAEAWDPFTRNNGYVSGDLTFNGLAGVTAAPATKYAITASSAQALAATTQWPMVNDAGFSIAMPAAGFESQGYQFGFYDNGLSPIPGAFFRINSFEGTTRGILGDEGGVLVEPGAPAPGFYSVNRDSSTSAKMFFFSATTPNGTTVSTNYSNTTSTFRGIQVAIGALNITTAGFYYGSSNWLSFLATHTHLTFTDSSNLFSGVTLMRGLFGGGLPNDITTQPSNSVVLFGNNRTFVVSSPSATAYQWRKNGTDIGGATQSSYTVTGAALSDFGTYQASIAEPTGQLLSSPAQLATVTTTTVSNWVQNVDINGPIISSNSIWAVDQMWNGFVTDGIDTKMYSVNCYVPDNLTAALTPLLQPSGVAYTWINHGFLTTDLTVNGLISDGSKFLDTQVSDSATFSSVNDIGFTLYFYAAPSDTGLIGIITPDDQGGYLMNANRSGNAQWYDYGPASGGAGNLHVASPGAGYYCGTRTSSSAEAFYFASSGSAHAALATGSTAPTEALVGINVYIFNCDGLSVPTTNKRISYTSISKGVTSTDSSHQYNRVQTMRTVLGGGFQ